MPVLELRQQLVPRPYLQWPVKMEPMLAQFSMHALTVLLLTLTVQ